MIYLKNKQRGGNQKMKKLAYGYIRVSGQSQIKGDGFVRQETAIEDYAKKNNITIKKIYQEKGVSGTLKNRPALTDMLYDLEMNGQGVKTIIVEKVDRLARDLMIQESIIADLRKKDIGLISTMEGDDLLSNDPFRKLIRQVLGAFAEYEKEMIVVKLRAARDRKSKKEKKRCEGRLSYQEAQPEVIKEIGRLRRKKKGMKRLSYKRVAEELNKKDFKTMNKKDFTGQVVQNILQ